MPRYFRERPPLIQRIRHPPILLLLVAVDTENGSMHVGRGIFRLLGNIAFQWRHLERSRCVDPEHNVIGINRLTDRIGPTIIPKSLGPPRG